MNTPAGNTLSTAEHTIAMMLALSRNIAPAYQSLIEGKWDRNHYMGTQLADKTLGIVGLGRIGQAVGQRAKALQMRVLGFDPFLSQRARSGAGHSKPCASVAEMLPQVDYLTVHTPLTDETRNLIGMPQLEQLRPGVRLINCARGGIYDEAALVEGLKSGKIGGVALDVFANEPCTNSPLFGMPGVLCTPHLGASTEEAQAQVAVEGVGLLVDYLTTGAIRHAVNMTPLDAKTLAELRGYLDVGYRLGLLLAQFESAPIKRCTLQYRGEVAGKNTKLITASFAAGLLANALEEDINIVNAEVLLRERGIELVEQRRSDMGAFSSVVLAEVETEKRHAQGRRHGVRHRHAAAGAARRLPARSLPRRRADGLHAPATCRASSARSARSSASTRSTSRRWPSAARPRGAKRSACLNLDQAPPQAALDEVRAHPAINSAIVIKLPPAGERPAWLAG